MQIEKLEQELAVRLPADIVDFLELKEGDEVEIQVTRKREAEPEVSREEAIEPLRARRIQLPLDWKLSREEANSR